MSKSTDDLEALLQTLLRLTAHHPAIALELQMCHDAITLLLFEGRRREHKEAMIIAALGIGAQRYTDIIRETQLPPPTVARLLNRLCDSQTIEEVRTRAGPLYQIRKPTRPARPLPDQSSNSHGGPSGDL
jgi:hypothetical protein